VGCSKTLTRVFERVGVVSRGFPCGEKDGKALFCPGGLSKVTRYHGVTLETGKGELGYLLIK
jgi:hypothetical protein